MLLEPTFMVNYLDTIGARDYRVILRMEFVCFWSLIDFWVRDGPLSSFKLIDQNVIFIISYHTQMKDQYSNNAVVYL